MTYQGTGICAKVISIGPPQYIPVYLIGHGVGVLKSRSDALGFNPDFDSWKTWRELLRDGLVCSAQ